MKKGVPEDKISVVRNWIDTDKVKHISREDNLLFDELKLPRDGFYVVYAGNLGKVQGVDVILKTASLMKNYRDIKFVIFGNGSEEENLKKIVNDKHLDNVLMLPLQPIERASEVYSMADVSIISCTPGTGGSGMPSKTWTIMAAGVPIKQAGCGYCVQSGSVEDLMDAVMKIYGDRLATTKMAENSRCYAVKMASKEKSVALYIESISKILEKGKSHEDCSG